MKADDAEHRYLQILDTAPDAMVIMSTEGNITFVNLQVEKLFGYARSDLLGQRLDVLIPERFRHAHGGHIDGYFTQPKTRSMGFGLEVFGRRADGTEMAIEVSLSPVSTHDGMFVSAAIRDITKRKDIEAGAKLNADRLASAVDSIQDAFALFDAHDRLVLCNSVYRHMVGEAVNGSLVGMTYEQLLDVWLVDIEFADDAERDLFRGERLVQRREPTSTFDVRMHDGRSLRVIDRRTAEGGLVKTIWDLTGNEQRAEELRAARNAAEMGSAAKSEFLSSMSHELRTPLNAILGFAQLLQRDKKEPLSVRHIERVDQILKGGEHLLRLIDDILDLSRIEAGAVSISTEEVDVMAVLREVNTTLEFTATRAGIRMTITPTSAEVPMIAADRTRFVQILINYASNAIKYNRPGGTVTFMLAVHPESVRVTVADTGMGIAPEKQDKLFQPFQRAGQETGPIEGTGIGLTISRRLAELMQGSVGFRSELSKGSEFWVEMPVHTSDVKSIAIPVLAREDVRLDGERRCLILYVEDNPANVTFMKDLLSTFDGIELISAPTAEMGVELARGRVPQVIIMDINLPGMSGLDALRILRDRPETRRIPVIALTAAASERDRGRGKRAGFYRYLTKPVKAAELEDAIETLLAR
jgi:PAS domain S-box-containing protein